MLNKKIYIDSYGVRWRIRMIEGMAYVWNMKLGTGLWDNGRDLTLS